MASDPGGLVRSLGFSGLLRYDVFPDSSLSCRLTGCARMNTMGTLSPAPDKGLAGILHAGCRIAMTLPSLLRFLD